MGVLSLQYAIELFSSSSILHIKYFIYIQRLINNNTMDLYVYLTKIKLALEVEYAKHKQNKVTKLNKFIFIYENI